MFMVRMKDNVPAITVTVSQDKNTHWKVPLEHKPIITFYDANSTNFKLHNKFENKAR